MVSRKRVKRSSARLCSACKRVTLWSVTCLQKIKQDVATSSEASAEKEIEAICLDCGSFRKKVNVH